MSINDRLQQSYRALETHSLCYEESVLPMNRVEVGAFKNSDGICFRKLVE